MTFIVYGSEKNKIIDIFPGCWDNLEGASDPTSLWDFYSKHTGSGILVFAYCIDHECEQNYMYKPEWYIKPKDR